MGISINTLQAANLTWVLARQQSFLKTLPKPNDEIIIETCPSSISRIQCRRDFNIKNQAGDLLGHAIQNWVVLNMETRKAERVPEFISSRYPEEPKFMHPEIALKPNSLTKEYQIKEITTQQADIDINNHVNNMRYADFMLESTPLNPQSYYPLMLDIIFRAESMKGDTISSRLKQLANDELTKLDQPLSITQPAGDVAGFWHTLVKNKKTMLFITKEAEKELVRGFSLWKKDE